MVLGNKKIDIKKVLIYCSGFIWVALMEYWFWSDFRPYFGGILFEGPSGLTEAIVEFVEVGLLAVLTLFIGPKRSQTQKASDFIMYFFMCNSVSFALYPSIQGAIWAVALGVQYFLGRKEGASYQSKKTGEPSGERPIWLKAPYLLATAILGIAAFGSVLSYNRNLMEYPFYFATPFFGCTASVALFAIGYKNGRGQNAGWKLTSIVLMAGSFLIISLYIAIVFLVNPLVVW